MGGMKNGPSRYGSSRMGSGNVLVRRTQFRWADMDDKRADVARGLVAGQRVATGYRKVGAFVGDHAKTGVGTLLNTGTTIGAFCHVLPSGGYAPRQIPSFTHWSNGRLVEASSPNELLATAEHGMQRRDRTMTPVHRELYEKVWQETALERKQALRNWEIKTIRRSA